MPSIDSSSLILLAKIGMLDKTIESVTSKIVLTKKVEQESTEKRSTDASFIEERIKQKKLLVQQIPKHQSQSFVTEFNIGEGEAEAIALAFEENIPVITDDKKAIKVCKIFNIPFITTLSIITTLYHRKKIDKEIAQLAIEKLEVYGRYNKDMIKRAKEDL